LSEIDQEHEEHISTDLTDLAAFVERMVAVAQRAGMATLSIKTHDLKLELHSGTVVEIASNHAPQPVATMEDPAPFIAAAEPAGYMITAPMVGTFYRSTSPTDPPLLQPGDRVEVGQLIGIIEAMKIMNEITADRSGTVLEVIAENATAVEFGSPLIRLGP
jgi:acetyl-CoA carboxylase biotin carboxyl carrier protein